MFLVSINRTRDTDGKHLPEFQPTIEQLNEWAGKRDDNLKRIAKKSKKEL